MTDSDRSDALSTLAWGLRNYVWLALLALFIAGITVVAAVPSLAGQLLDRQEYRATALVLATRVEVGTARLPRLITAVYEQAPVAERAIADAELPWTAEDLRLDHVELEPLEDNVVTLVHGTSGDAGLSARTANAVAEALVAELNSAGPDVATFRLQTPAVTPDEPHRPLGPPAAVVVGILAGVASWLGLVALTLAWRRPVLAGGDLTEALGTPVVGTLTLPARPRWLPLDTPGVAALVRRVAPDRRGTFAFVSPAGSERARGHVATLVARRLDQLANTTFVPLAPDSVAPEGVRVSPPESLPGAWDAVVVDGPTAADVDAPQRLPVGSRVVIIVEEGTPRRRLEPLARQFVAEELVGVVMVRRGRRGAVRRRPGTAPSSAPAASDDDRTSSARGSR